VIIKKECAANPGDRNVNKRETVNILTYRDLIIEIQRMRNMKLKVILLITGNNSGDWNHLKITQTIPEQLTRKAQNYGNKKKSHIGHCTHNTESANVEVQNIWNNI
jgi:GTP cyclohydrolase II